MRRQRDSLKEKEEQNQKEILLLKQKLTNASLRRERKEQKYKEMGKELEEVTTNLRLVQERFREKDEGLARRHRAEIILAYITNLEGGAKTENIALRTLLTEIALSNDPVDILEQLFAAEEFYSYALTKKGQNRERDRAESIHLNKEIKTLQKKTKALEGQIEAWKTSGSI